MKNCCGVFDEPSDVARLLERVSNITGQDAGNLPDVASIPVLGLSNKAVGVGDNSHEGVNGEPASTSVWNALESVNEPTPEGSTCQTHTMA